MKRASLTVFVAAVVVMIALLGAASAVSATTLLSSFPQTSNGASSLNGTPPINVAAGFTLGGTAFNLTSATVEFSAVGIAQFSTSQIAADLYGGTGGPTGTPSGSPLVAFTIPAGTIAGNVNDITMTPASPFTLQAATTYWLVMRASASVNGNLGVNSAANAATGPFATYVGMTQDGSLPPLTRQGGNLMFAIDGTLPEPGAAGALALPCGVLALWRCRRCRRRVH